MRDSHLTPADLRGVGASLRRLFAVTDDGGFDRLLGQLDKAERSGLGSGRRN